MFEQELARTGISHESAAPERGGDSYCGRRLSRFQEGMLCVAGAPVGAAASRSRAAERGLCLMPDHILGLQHCLNQPFQQRGANGLSQKSAACEAHTQHAQCEAVGSIVARVLQSSALNQATYIYYIPSSR